jgi:hypothetical protein
VPEGNICINIYGGNRSSPWERGLTTAAAVVNQHTDDTNPFYVENLST